jgi:hypothetical protein
MTEKRYREEDRKRELVDRAAEKPVRWVYQIDVPLDTREAMYWAGMDAELRRSNIEVRVQIMEGTTWEQAADLLWRALKHVVEESAKPGQYNQRVEERAPRWAEQARQERSPEGAPLPDLDPDFRDPFGDDDEEVDAVDSAGETRSAYRTKCGLPPVQNPEDSADPATYRCPRCGRWNNSFHLNELCLPCQTKGRETEVKDEGDAG